MTNKSDKKDGWSNLVTGLGSAADKSKYTHHRLGSILKDDELESIYIDDGLGARIVNLLPSDMFREGWEYSFPGKEESEADELAEQYADIMEQIGAEQKAREALCWARLYGGSVILIGALDGQELNFPLNPLRIRSFDNLRVIDRSDIEFRNIQFQLDPLKPRYGLPEYYPIKFETPSGLDATKLVHHTRVIEIHGSVVPSGATKTLNREQRYWGLSVIQNVYEQLKTLGSALGGVSALLDDVSIGKYKLAGLADILQAEDGASLIQKRVEVMDLTRSVFHSMYFDTEDDFIRDTINFAGIPEILRIYFMLISSCTGYPMTRLFGEAPAGLNATGVGDMRNYYDLVRSEQINKAEPILLRLVKIISAWKNLEEPYIEWKPLQQMNEKEQAELEKSEADKDQVIANTWKTYLDAGILEPYQVQFLQFGDSLEKIPEPESGLPPVETIPMEQPITEPTQEEAPEKAEDNQE